MIPYFQHISVCHATAPCKNGLGSVWSGDSWNTNNNCIRCVLVASAGRLWPPTFKYTTYTNVNIILQYLFQSSDHHYVRSFGVLLRVLLPPLLPLLLPLLMLLLLLLLLLLQLLLQ